MKTPCPSQPGTTFPAPVNDQWDFLLSTIWSQMVHLVVALDGRLDAPRLDKAMSLVAGAEPLLACRFVDSPAPCWEKVPDLPPVSLFSLVQCAESTAALQGVLASRLDPSSGPQARLTLLRGQEDLLVLSVNHAVTDAHGVKQICGLIGSVYQHLGCDPGYVPDIRPPGDRSFHPIVSAFTPPARAIAREACGEQSAIWGIPASMGPCRDPAYCVRVLELPVFPGMKEYSRSRGVTINDLLLAAFFAALCEEIPHRRGHDYPLLTSTDLRRSLAGHAHPDIANLSVAFEVWLPSADPLSFPFLVGEVHRVMSEKKSCFAGIGAAIRLQEDFSAGFDAVRSRLKEMERRTLHEHYPKNPFFSNTGIISPESVSFGDAATLHAFMAPPVDYPPGFGITASTCRNRLTLVSGYCRDSVKEGLVSRVLSRMERHLSLPASR